MSELIDALLAESELPDDVLLRELLDELEREATAVRPMPSAALSELMSSRLGTPSLAHTRGARRRPSFAGRGAVITGVVVIGVLGLGAGAAAASPDARSAIGAGLAVIAHLFQSPTAHDPGSAPRPAHGATQSPVPTESPVPTGSPVPTESPEPSPSVTPSPSDQGAGAASSGDSNSGKDSGKGSGKNSGDTHGNGKGNQSGHGNGKGQGNGGPAPTP